MLRDPIDRPVDLVKAKALIWAALQVKEAYYKQWYLEQIGRALGIDMDWQREFAAEDPELTIWPRGVDPS